MRLMIVDTLASVVFFTTLAASTELFIAGMSPREVITTRLIMIPIMIATGRPYGAYRDWCFVKTRPTVGWSKTLVDAVAFVTFQLPIYAVTLMIAGADRGEIATLLPTTAALMLITSRPFGLFLEAARRLFGVTEDGNLP